MDKRIRKLVPMEREILTLCAKKYPSEENVIRLCSLLKEEDIDLNCRNQDGYSPYTLLCYNIDRAEDSLHYRSIRVLLEQVKEKKIAPIMYSKNFYDRKILAPHNLCQCYRRGDLLEMLHIFMALEIDLAVKDGGLTALDVICTHYKEENLLEIVRLFSKLGVDFKTKSASGHTALHYLFEGYKKTNLIEIVRIYVAGGADLNSIDSVGRTPLSILCEKYGNENLIDIILILLVDGGADPNLYGLGEFTSLYYLCTNYKRGNLVDIIQLFIDAKVDVNATDDYQMQDSVFVDLCYHYDRENLIDIVRIFIEAGVDLNEQGMNKKGALHYLCERYTHESILFEIVRLFKVSGFGKNSTRLDDTVSMTQTLIECLHKNDKIKNKDKIEYVLRSISDPCTTDAN